MQKFYKKVNSTLVSYAWKMIAGSSKKDNPLFRTGFSM